MLIGKYDFSVDSKNRIFLPSKFRHDLAGICVLSKDMQEKCLNLYPPRQWELFTQKIEELPTIKMKKVRELIYSKSCEIELDSQGRVVLNENFCDDVGVRTLKEKEVVIVGINTHVQIWGILEWQEHQKELNSDENVAAAIDDLIELGF